MNHLNEFEFVLRNVLTGKGSLFVLEVAILHFREHRLQNTHTHTHNFNRNSGNNNALKV